ncbi:MAG: hypothetical protein COB42_04590 [Sulfurimonas sp.]|nr:MAG: hypothetical protein COB42_04590 [Sulfurimonas sp.]
MKHPNYDILNLIGYGLAKFNNDFIVEFDCKTKTEFYNLMLSYGIVDTTGVVKNRQDLFDNFFDNNRKGWWQKGDAYLHRKIYIDSLFGTLSNKEYADTIKIYIQNKFQVGKILSDNVNPIITTRFKQLQETGLEAELFFSNNYSTTELFKGATIEDARLYGDGYDYQMHVSDKYYLAEVKGIRKQEGKIRLTKNEYLKAQEYQDQYVLSVIVNLDDIPKIKLIPNPLKELDFKKVLTNPKQQVEYHLMGIIC